jgi:hypothetical protein
MESQIMIRSLLTAVLLCAAACDPAVDDDDVDALAQSSGSTVTVPSGTPVVVPNPSNIYIANFRAEGSGCPRGSWASEISNDGLSITVYFDKYEIKADKVDLQTKNCTLLFEMKSPAGLSFGVTGIDYMGFAELTAGQSMTHTAYYTFVGGLGSSVNLDGPGIRESVHPLAGPYDNGYVFRDEVDTRDVVYSECGRPSALLVNTRLVLRNPGRLAEGLINMGFVNATQRTKLVLKLSPRNCPKK